MYSLLGTFSRCTVLVLLTGAAFFATAATPDFSGKWVLDASKSEDVNGSSIELNIQQDSSGKINYQRIDKESDGKQTEAKFSCAPVGSWCELTENGHKAKVSLWYDGSALIMAKTGGPNKDETTERKMELSADGKT